MKARRDFLKSLEPNTLMSLPYLFEFWALPHQIPPQGDWRSWVVLGGRGAGKTRAGAEWVRTQVEGGKPNEPGTARRVALVGDTFDQVRDVMIFGDSGILACSPPDRRPVWSALKRTLEWPNGATAQAFSAQDAQGLRGPQFDAAWSDELAKWTKGKDVWDMLQFALRLGGHPQQVVTTSPQNVKVLKELLGEPTTVSTHAKTDANRANLAKSFLAEVRRKYFGTRLGRQELDGEFLSEADGALWTYHGLEAVRAGPLPDFSRIVVAVDPPMSGHAGSDACGIVVAGAVTDGPREDWYAIVVEDASVQGRTPLEWAQCVIAAFERHQADRVVAEVNQGGDLVGAVLAQVDALVPFKKVHATHGKGRRAEPGGSTL